MDSICACMHKHKNRPYTDDELRQVARRFNTRGEFAKGNASAYRVAHNRGDAFFDDICAHMRQRSQQRNGDSVESADV
jgi:hypothetical protein